MLILHHESDYPLYIIMYRRRLFNDDENLH